MNRRDLLMGSVFAAATTAVPLLGASQARAAGTLDLTLEERLKACSALGTPLILVLGHSECCAVQAAMASTPLTSLLEDLVKPIRACFHVGDTLTGAIQNNIRAAARQLTRRSAMLEEACTSGRLRISSAYFDIATGVVTLL